MSATELDQAQPRDAAFNSRLPFTKETLVPVLAAEFARVQQLGSVIDQTIADVRR